MEHLTRRNFLKVTGASVALLSWPKLSHTAETIDLVPDTQRPSSRSVTGQDNRQYITCFYQFGKQALAALGGQNGLPNGPQYLHIFSHSHPGMQPHPDTAHEMRALGNSFKYALAFDVHKYKGWQTATDDQLKTWATQFREQALDANGPADYFAFNEMPTTGSITPHLRAQTAQLVRHLHNAGGGPKLRGVFYFTERNLNPNLWTGDADDFWAALDETCDLVVGEHYHSYSFAMEKTAEQYAAHLFALPQWLKATGKPAQTAIANSKYAVLHSSFYGTPITGWAGVESDKQDEASLDKYFQHVVEATRLSEFGQQRIAFGPLATKNLDPRALPVLARVLHQDTQAFAAEQLKTGLQDKQ
ncbi:MAG: hypothetical protein JO316_02435 [Abitibacteriaceae bacterium]|nr:hypothetical protein [Abditibacteriaceae bacterium]MBV9864186.1 hypothetical protein [Abditibacteriaceae bacterium]